MYDFFHRNPRLMILAICMIFVAGVSSYLLSPRMEDPVLSQRLAIINTVFPGANAERVEALVTEPIEEELREVDEIMNLTSESQSGNSLITIELADNVYDVDPVWSRVRDRISDASAELPTEAGIPRFRELDTKAYAMIVALTWERDDEPNYSILRRHAEDLKDRLLGVSGTEKVTLFGDVQEEYVATIDEDMSAAMGITAAQIAQAVQASDSKISAGLVRGESNDFVIEVGGELTSFDQISQMPIRVLEDGTVFRLEDIATLEKSITQPVSTRAIVDGKPSITLGALVQAPRRIDQWTEQINLAQKDYQKELPPGIGLKVVFQQNDYVASRLKNLMANLVLGATAVMLVILLLMGWRSAIVIVVALPLSALMVVSGMRFFGNSDSSDVDYGLDHCDWVVDR